MTILSPLSVSIPFRRPDTALGALGSDVAARVVAASSDVALVLDHEGVVRDLSVSSGKLAGSGIGEWLDRPWLDTVTGADRDKAADLLRDAATAEASRWREIEHPTEHGKAFSIRWFALGSGESGGIIVIGRDVQATVALQERLLEVQQSVERDYVLLRQAEGRYRLLFRNLSEGVLILDAATRRVREANPAAARMTGLVEGALEGQGLAALLDAASVEPALAALAAATGAVTPPSVEVRLANGLNCRLSGSMFRQDRAAYLMVTLTSHSSATGEIDPAHRLNAVVQEISDGFVVTDADLKILSINSAFLDLTHLAGVEDARGQSLDQFLGRPQIDIKFMLAQLKEHRGFRNVATLIRGRNGETEDVEVSGVSVAADDTPIYGFAIRGVARRADVGSAPIGVGNAAVPRSVEQMTQLIGRVPMKEIVRESTDLIERLCIEAALSLTGNNRASAADLLGLSRQSLYSKLARYGLGAPEDVIEA